MRPSRAGRSIRSVGIHDEEAAVEEVRRGGQRERERGDREVDASQPQRGQARPTRRPLRRARAASSNGASVRSRPQSDVALAPTAAPMAKNATGPSETWPAPAGEHDERDAEDAVDDHGRRLQRLVDRGQERRQHGARRRAGRRPADARPAPRAGRPARGAPGGRLPRPARWRRRCLAATHGRRRDQERNDDDAAEDRVDQQGARRVPADPELEHAERTRTPPPPAGRSAGRA